MLQLILSVQMGSHKTFRVEMDNFRYQLDIKRRFVSKSILGTVVVIKSMKYDGYTYSQVTTFMVCSNIMINEMVEKFVIQSTLHQLLSCNTRWNHVSHIILYPFYHHIKMCLHKIKSMYAEKKLLHLWWVDTFMVCCYIYKNLWRP